MRPGRALREEWAADAYEAANLAANVAGRWRARVAVRLAELGAQALLGDLTPDNAARWIDALTNGRIGYIAELEAAAPVTPGRGDARRVAKLCAVARRTS